MEIVVTEKNDHKILMIDGEINLSTVNTIRETANKVLESFPSSIVMDMRNVYLVDSTGIAALFAIQKKIEALKGNFYLANMSETVGNIILLTGIKFKILELKDED